jgi:hypothetical protein
MSELISPATSKYAAKSCKSAPFKTALCKGGGGISPKAGLRPLLEKGAIVWV